MKTRTIVAMGATVVVIVLVLFGTITWLNNQHRANTEKLRLWTELSDVIGIYLTPDDKSLVAIGDSGVVVVWGLPSYQLRHFYSVPNESAHAYAILEDGKTLATIGIEGNLTLSNLDNGELILHKKLERIDIVESMLIDINSGDLLTADISDNLVAHNQFRNNYRAIKSHLGANVLAYSAKHNLTLAWSNWGSLRGATVEKNGLVESFSRDFSRVSQMHSHSKSDYLAISKRDGSVCVMDLTTKNVVFDKVIHQAPTLCIQMSSLGLILSGSSDESAAITNWKDDQSKPLRVFHSSRVTAVCFSNDETAFFVGSQGFHITMHDISTGKKLRALHLE